MTAEHNIVKLVVDLPEKELEQLQKLADEQEISMTDAIRKAVATERYLRGHLKQGTKVLLRKPDNSYREVTLP